MFKNFINYVEVRTKITSIFAFLISIALLFYMKESINWKLTLIFFAAMFIFDLTTTAINNYVDTKTNNERLQFKRSTALIIIYVMFLISATLGLYLAYLTDLVVLLLGALCFLCGVFYTFGPLPISRQPLGELFSGLFYGLLIPFILLYINMPKGTFITLNVDYQSISINLKIMPTLKLLLFSIVPFCTTANIMLANNICDLEKDIKVKRYTLPYYLGHKSLYLYAGLYYLSYASVIIMVVLKFLSPLYLISLLTLFFVQKNINKFYKVQDKEKTFILSIKNYLIIMGSNTIIIFISSVPKL
ncbi:1,4-dihydroxy-2-naphthoate octaprenyltransferase [Sedimentibacter acidaminivorans]|uniref:1,4-dihydroxy-2-naphthoate octaprenyltransferase n=1 Tax=Sedimentibacter acidaminivorans TaxID=913099 RepID=A0ABS4GEE5_9FIRM|nr:UbiA family prenyltransferase [Sedimentibacter acidaminivorans]MBP1926012.1 1,4-dihydroxy-2-naphthoate octaprenyltransferase [Sedimentibacter acidaminivorans]